MKATSKRAIVACAGGLWIMLAHASAANAEDIELFVGGGQTSIQAQPNILLILDDSGSMDSVVESQVDYDPSVTYDGTCDSSRVYWAEHSFFGFGGQPEPPDEDECGSTDRWIAYNSFVCQEARNAFMVIDGGTYTDRMAQFRTDTDRWDDIDDDFNNRIVECEDDWGEHGDGSSASAVYPRNNDQNNKWTSNPGSAIDWDGFFGFGGVGSIYSVYHGNYVNWLNGPGANSTRIEIMQEVASNLINSVGGVNIGLMSFDNDDGGLVRHAITDVGGSRSSLISAINDLEANGFTPLSETLYEAHQYFRGANVVYGDNGVAAARDPSDDDQYATPMEYSCQKNHIVLLTDGEPTRDFGADDEITDLVDAQGDSFSDLTGSGTCDTESYPSHLSPEGGVCLDDLAHYMFEGDLSFPLDGQQNVTTHTVGFWVDLPVLEDAAQRGGGNYYTADDTGSLSSALTAIVTNILETQSTFVAPAVSVNAFNQTRNLNDLYFSVFRPSGSAHWPGNLKKYELRPSDATIVDAQDDPAVNPDTGFFAENSESFWSGFADGPDVELGGAASLIPNPRSVYTYISGTTLTASGNVIESGNMAVTDELLGTDIAGPTREQVIDYINGLDPADFDNDDITDEPRNQMGDPLHSRPATVIYGPDNTDGRIYFATNDGYLHSIHTNTGVEQWAFVPPEFLENQRELMVDSATDDKTYGIDGNIVVQTVADHDNEIESGEKVYIFFGMRRGGSVYYGLDVSNPDQPEVLWRLDASDLPGLGQSWSTPLPTRIDIQDPGVTQNEDKTVLVFGGGYDTSQDNELQPADPDVEGNAIYIVDSETGDLLWHASDSGANLNLSTDDGNNATMNYSIPADVRAVDLNSDGYADRIYAGDMGGQVWRFDVHNGADDVDDLITGGAIAQLGAAHLQSPTVADSRRFYNAPDVAFVSNDQQTFMHVGIGSGYRSHPNNTDVSDRFYALRDYGAFTWLTQSEFDALDPTEDSDLVEVANDIGATVAVNSAGWKFSFDAAGTDGEKVLAEALTFDGEVFFSTFRPGSSGDSCTPALGTNRQYRVSLLNASPVTNLDGEVDADNDGEPDPFTSGDRFSEDDGSILSRTTVIFAEEDDGDGTGSGGLSVVGITEMSTSNLNPDLSPRRTFWTQESVE